MPVQWTVSHPTRLVIAVAKGDLRLLDIEHYLDGVVTADVLAYRKIFDMKSILDPSFRYVPSTQTDIRKTFSRIRREMARANAQSGREQGLVVMLSHKRQVASH